jgi:hypothetical protein
LQIRLETQYNTIGSKGIEGGKEKGKKDKSGGTVSRFWNSIHFMIWWQLVGYKVIYDGASLRGFCHWIRLQSTIHTTFYVRALF